MATQSRKQVKAKKAKEDIYLVAIDVGFGFTKILSNHTKDVIHFESAILPGKPNNKATARKNSIDLNRLTVTTEEGTFFIGKHAITIPSGMEVRTKFRNRANDTKSRNLFRAGIGLGVPDEDGEYQVKVITGLPNSDYELSHHKELIDFLKQPFEVIYHLGGGNTITKKIDVVDVEVHQQPLGTITYSQYQFLFDGDAILGETEQYADRIGVIDFGHLTTDYAIFTNGEFIDYGGIADSTMAVSEVYARLKAKAKAYFAEIGYEFNPRDSDLDEIIKNNGYYKFAQQEFNLSDQINEAVQEIIPNIAQVIADSWKDEANRLDVILTTGGGSHVFSQALEEQFQKMNIQGVKIAESPQFSNVIGFYMLGVMS